VIFLYEFIHDDTAVNTPKIKVVTKISKWDKYDFVEMNDNLWICGSSTKQGSELFSFQEVNNPNILFRLLELQAKIKTPYSSNHKYMIENYCNDDTGHILAFCKRFGLAIWGNPSNSVVSSLSDNDTEKNTLLRPVIPLADCNYMNIPSFLFALHNIKMDFLKIVYNKGWQDDTNISPLISKKEKNMMEKMVENKCTHVMELAIKRQYLYYPSQLPFVTYFDTGSMRLALNCENLLHLAIYQLCLMLQGTDFTGGYICRCKKCGELFYTSQSRQKFCNNPCTRQSYYNYNKRHN
jgi:hypothetical protein